tara:strand:+ start:2494 stop:2838 length:345 start_codon:yes stop_codon:yes gene_type:complete
MKIQIKDRWFHDTNSTTDKWVTEIHEYEPTLEDAKEWAKEEEGNGQGQLVFIQLVTETTSVDVIDKYVPRIEKEYERLLKNDYYDKVDEAEGQAEQAEFKAQGVPCDNGVPFSF